MEKIHSLNISEHPQLPEAEAITSAIEKIGSLGLEVGTESRANPDRPNRNDDVVFFDTKMSLAGVLDGVGSLKGSGEAAQLAAAIIQEDFIESADDDSHAKRLVWAIQAANQQLFKRNTTVNSEAMMGATTVVLAELHAAEEGKRKLSVAWVGDSQAFVMRKNGTLEELTYNGEPDIVEDEEYDEDDEYESTHDAGKVASPSQFTESLGTEKTLLPSFVEEEVAAGEIVLLCSDGITRNLTPDEIEDIIDGGHDASVISAHLVSAAERHILEQSPGSHPDDLSAVIIKVGSLPSNPEKGPAVNAKEQYELQEKELEAEVVSVDLEARGHKPFSIVTLENGALGVFKEADQPTPIIERHVAPDTYYIRERASYLVSKALGLNFVPPVVIREVEGKLGSLQKFVPDAPPLLLASNNKRQELPDEAAERLALLAMFDYIVWNSDCHEANVLYDGESFYAIDNSTTFDTYDDPLMRFKMSGVPMSDESVALFTSFVGDEEAQKALRQELHVTGLSRESIDSCLTRVEIIAKILADHNEIPSDEAMYLVNRGRPQFYERRAA